MRLLKVLIPCTLALAVAACGRVETSAAPIPTLSPIGGASANPGLPTTAPAGPTQDPNATADPQKPTPKKEGPQTVDPSKIVLTSSGLKYADLKVGTGTEAAAGKQVSVNYTGWLQNGTKFDSSYDRGQPIQLTLGSGQVIKGWDEGLVGMKVGGQRQLIIPPELGYGAAAQGPIPANSTLIFEVELVDVK